MPKAKSSSKHKKSPGKLRIGDHWNAISIIAVAIEPGYSPEQLIERIIEPSLYTEENLR